MEEIVQVPVGLLSLNLNNFHCITVTFNETNSVLHVKKKDQCEIGSVIAGEIIFKTSYCEKGKFCHIPYSP